MIKIHISKSDIYDALRNDGTTGYENGEGCVTVIQFDQPALEILKHSVQAQEFERAQIEEARVHS